MQSSFHYRPWILNIILCVAIELREVHHETNKLLSSDVKSLPITVYADNASSIKLSANPVYHQRSKHIGIRLIRLLVLRQLFEKNIIRFEYVASSDNIADILTKPLHKKIYVPLRSRLMGKFTVLLK